ncbi:hypothetical protein ACRDU6_07755 [Mycolicibacterium sp. ELW1]|uniref:hypothetical protein n=1 Tax=Mycobacteriaceae TaxID=1762 RepID=UPI0011ED47CC|nr:hypothetical protein [Mycobacterium sp. ELW1]QEN12585.1 hypothetical protein D3H54_04310 [Mycobacterium sp. ELW1]
MSLGQQGRYIGRVGALAVALGVGGVIAALPAVASADTGAGDSGKATASAGKHAPRTPAKPDGRTPKAPLPAAATKPARAISASSRVPLARLGVGHDPLAPVTEAISWAVLAVTRREQSGPTGISVPASSVTTAEPADGIAHSARTLNHVSPSQKTGSAASVPSVQLAEVPAAAEVETSADMTFWNDVVAPALTDFVELGIKFSDLTAAKQAVVNLFLPVAIELMGEALYGDPVNGALSGLAGNPDFATFVSNQVETSLAGMGASQGAAQVAGAAAAYWCTSVLNDTFFQNAFGTFIQTLTVIPNGGGALDLLGDLVTTDFTVNDLVSADLLESAPTVVGSLAAFLTDEGVQRALATATFGAVNILLGAQGDPASTDFVTFIGDSIGNSLASALGGGPAAIQIGAAISQATVTFLTTPAVQAKIADVAGSLFGYTVDGEIARCTGLFCQSGVAGEIGSVVGTLFAAVGLGDNQADAIEGAVQSLQGSTAVQDGIAGTVASAVFSLWADSAVQQGFGTFVTDAVSAFTADSATRLLVGQRVEQSVTSALGGGPVAVGVGAAVSTAVQNLLANPAGVNGLLAVAGAALSYVGIPIGVSTVIEQVLPAIIAGTDPVTALANAWPSLRTSSAIEDSLPLAVKLGLQTLFSYQGLLPALGAFITDVVSGSAASEPVQAWVGQQVQQGLTAALSGSAAAAGIGSAVGAAVQNLVANVTFVNGVLGAAGSALTTLLGTSGIAADLTGAGEQVIWSLLAGNDVAAAVGAAWQGLQSDSMFTSALGTAVASAVYAFTSDTGVVAALAATTSALVSDLASDAAFRTFLGALAGPTFGPTLVSTLADPAAATQIAATLGSLITGFLGYAGVPGALSNAAQDFVAALSAGATVSGAVQGAVQYLQADSAIKAALDAIIPPGLRSLLTVPAVQQAVGEAAQGLVADFLGTTPFHNAVLDSLAGQVTKVAVDSLLSNPSVQTLISSLAGDIVNGTPTSDLADTVIQAVVRSPALQVAIGMALGQGIGSLFGANPVGFLVGQVTGATAALLIGLLSGVSLIVDQVSGSAAAVAPRSNSYLLIRVPAA